MTKLINIITPWFIRYGIAISISTGLIVSLLLSYVAFQYQIQTRKQLFQANFQNIESRLTQAFSTGEAIAFSMQAFFHASKHVDEREFTAFVDSIFRQYPYIDASLYYQKINASEKNEYESALAIRQLPNDRIFGFKNQSKYYPDNKPYYFPLTYMQAIGIIPLKYIGLDALSQKNTNLVNNIENAIISGTPYASIPTKSPESNVYHINYYIPTYINNSVPPTEQQRMQMIEGVIDIALSPDSIISSNELPENYHFSLRVLNNDNDKDNSIPHNFIWSNGDPKLISNFGYLEDSIFINTSGLTLIFTGKEIISNSSIDYTSLTVIFYTGIFVAVIIYLLVRSAISERAAIESNNTKNDFISTVSHELRTPLTSIHGSLALISGGAAGDIPSKAQHLINIASNNCSRLVRLINDMLDIEKIESGSIKLALKPSNLSTIIHSAIDANKSYADSHSVKTIVHALPTQLPVMIDEDRIQQVLDNLLSNAAKFSKKGARIDINSSISGDFIRISITDHGRGIPAQFRSKIFGKFAQADTSDTKDKGGTGLGLSISKAIIELHGGKIGFDSFEGVGSTFWFELPKSDQTLQQLIQSEKILICEDDPDIARLLSIILENKGISSDIAYTGEQAQQLLETNHYRAMTLDLMLPDQSGIDILKDLRNNPATENLPIIVVSAISDTTSINDADNTFNVSNWINKPIDETKLIDSIKNIIGNDNKSDINILHVEDDPDIHQLLLQSFGNNYNIDLSVSLADARNRLLSKTYNLVILDIGLPDGTGLDLIKDINEINPDTIIYIFSAHDVDTEWTKQVSSVFLKSKHDVEMLASFISNSLLSDRFY